MVGVPRRSRGCEACKKRRLTCDLKRPQCAHCKQEKRDCRFPNAFTFVVNDPGSHKTVYRKPSPGHGRRENDNKNGLVRVQEVTTPPGDPVHDDGLLLQDHTMDIVTRPTTHHLSPNSNYLIPTTTPPSLSQQLPVIPSLHQALLSHALQNLRTHPKNDTSLIRIWIPTLQNFATSLAPLKSSPLACCAAWLAKGDTTTPSLQDFSRHLYAQGLSEVRTALRRPGAILEDETLGACLALAVFEIIQCPDQCRAAYEWHRRASVNLVQMRGAMRHREGVGHDLFLAVRVHGIFYAYEQRRPNYLCTREWCTVPWQFQPKDDFHRLADILARGPQLLYESDTLPLKSPSQTLPTLLTILSRLLDIDADLTKLYGEFEGKAHAKGEELFWEGGEEDDILSPFPPITNAEDSPSNPPPTPRPLHFPTLHTASLLTLHWSIQTMVWSALSNLHSTLSHLSALALLPTTPRTTHFLALAPRNIWLHAVRKITRSVSYSIRAAEAEGARTPPGIGVALEVVIDVMKDREGAEVEWEMKRAMRGREELGRRWVAILLA